MQLGAGIQTLMLMETYCTPSVVNTRLGPLDFPLNCLLRMNLRAKVERTNREDAKRQMRIKNTNIAI